MYNSIGQKLWVRDDYQWVKLTEMNADVPSFYVIVSKRIKIWYGRQIGDLEIQKTLCSSANRDNSIDTTCLNLTVSRVHVFLNSIRVHMLCDGYRSKLVTESTLSGGFQFVTCQ